MPFSILLWSVKASLATYCNRKSKINQNIFQNFTFFVSWKKAFGLRTTKRRQNLLGELFLYHINSLSFMQLFICNLLPWILFLMCIFFLSPDHTVHTTSRDQRRASKQQEESEAKGVCLSLHLIPMLLKHSSRHHPAPVWARPCLFHRHHVGSLYPIALKHS